MMGISAEMGTDGLLHLAFSLYSFPESDGSSGI